MSRTARKRRRSVMRSTLLVVGEGADDWAFISHMKELYCPRNSGLSVKVEPGDGGSPGNVITHAIRAHKNKDYDRRLFLLDADLPPSDAERKRAAAAGYEIILWQPQCLEGALLETLGEPVRGHETSRQLKARLHPRLAGRHTDAAAYAVPFPRPVLDATGNLSIVSLRTALLSP